MLKRPNELRPGDLIVFRNKDVMIVASVIWNKLLARYYLTCIKSIDRKTTDEENNKNFYVVRFMIKKFTLTRWLRSLTR